ncbi:MAG: hypothetical protein V4494_03700 [Chlamydiota bacterium]
MKSLFRYLFIDNWQRKLIATVLAIIIWLVVNHTLTGTKIFSNVPVKIVNIPTGRTIEGMQVNGVLSKKISLTVVGNKPMLDSLSSNDIEVVIDASDKQGEWLATVTKKNLVSLNPDLNISTGIDRISHSSFPIHMSRLVTEKIPIFVTQPIGEPPRDYLFLDIWPYRLSMTITGPEDIVKRLKAKGQKLTFSLNDITKADLDALPQGDEVSYFVPNDWKQISLPGISETPIQIDDTNAKTLRIDFVRCDLLPLDNPIPLTVYYPPEYSDQINPGNTGISISGPVRKIHGLSMISGPLYVKGVSRLFVEVVSDMLQIAIIAVPKSERPHLEWSVQFINPHVLEDKYVSTLLSDTSDNEVQDLQPNLREDYLRNRFRSYMNRFQLYKSEESPLKFNIELEDGQITVNES